MTKVPFQDFDRLVAYVMAAHQMCPRKPENAFRKFDGVTPYAVHPLWCATMAAAEPLLPPETRDLDAQVLLLHDVTEDTLAPFPTWVSDEVRAAHADMVFESRAAEMARIWVRTPGTRRRKLFDKASNYLTLLGTLNPDYDKYVLRLADTVEKDAGSRLNIVKIIRALVLVR